MWLAATVRRLEKRAPFSTRRNLQRGTNKARTTLNVFLGCRHKACPFGLEVFNSTVVDQRLALPCFTGPSLFFFHEVHLSRIMLPFLIRVSSSSPLQHSSIPSLLETLTFPRCLSPEVSRSRINTPDDTPPILFVLTRNVPQPCHQHRPVCLLYEGVIEQDNAKQRKSTVPPRLKETEIRTRAGFLVRGRRFSPSYI